MADVSRASKERASKERASTPLFRKVSAMLLPVFARTRARWPCFFFFFFSHRGPPHLIVAVRDRNKTLVITTVLAFLVSREFFFSLLGQRRNFEI